MYYTLLLISLQTFSEGRSKCFEQEMRIYSIAGFEHSNVLKYIDSLERERKIVFEYHSRGSLFDFLSHSTVNLVELYQMTRSLCLGQ